MKIFRNIGFAVIAAAGLCACSDVEIPETPAVEGATALTYTIEGKSVTLTWGVPAGDVEAVELYKDNNLVGTFTPDITTYTIARQGANREVLYTVKVVWADGKVSEGLTVPVTIVAEPAHPAYLMDVNDPSELTDDDEVAAAAWFAATYPDGVFLTPAEFTADPDPDKYGMIWINIDREGLAAGYRKLPAKLRDGTAVQAYQDFMAMGGNIFLTKQAVQLTVPMGLLSAAYAPTIYGSGAGGEGNDTWSINANIMLQYGHSGHPAFLGLQRCNDFGYETFPFVGPGWREDHNCCWNLAEISGLEANPDLVADFEDKTNSVVLGTWGQVTADDVVAMIEFLPTLERPGRVIAMGAAAYEFNQNTPNPYQANIELFTSNCINYLMR